LEGSINNESVSKAGAKIMTNQESVNHRHN